VVDIDDDKAQDTAKWSAYEDLLSKHSQHDGKEEKECEVPTSKEYKMKGSEGKICDSEIVLDEIKITNKVASKFLDLTWVPDHVIYQKELDNELSNEGF